MGALAETSPHAGGQSNGRFAKAVAQRRRRPAHAFQRCCAISFEQIDLRGLRTRRSDACTPSRRTCASLLPVLAEQRADLLEDFGVELGGARQGVGAGDGREVLVAQLELDGAGVKLDSRRRRPTISESRIRVDSSCAGSAVSSL